MEKTVQKKHLKIPVSKIIIVALLILYLLWLFVPFYVVFITSFVSDAELQSTMSFVWFPKQFVFDAYKTVFTEDMYVQNGFLAISSLIVGFLNSMWISIVQVGCSLVFGGLAAYSYSKVEFIGKNKIFMLQLATMMIPMGSLTVISYVFYDAIGWTHTFLPLIIPGMFGGASMIFFLRSYFDQISSEFVEAAKIDGLGNLGAYFCVMMPIAVPAFAAQFIFAFVGSFNNLAGPLLYLYPGDPATYTLQVVLSEMRDQYSSAAVTSAVALVGIIPLVIVYAFTQKFFIEGIAVGGVKG